MKIKVFALLAVLVMFAGVFTSCDKNDLDPVIPQQNEQFAQSAPASKELRSSRATYTVADKYRNKYSHYTSWHNIAPGFVSWWNCIAKAEGEGTIATQDIIALGKGNKKLVKLSQLQSAYPGLKVDGFSDGTFTAKRLFELYLEENLDGGQPCAVLIRNNYHGSWKNVLVVVMDYRNGNVSYQDPKASTYGTMDISTFIQYAKDASEAEDGIPKVNVVHW